MRVLLKFADTRDAGSLASRIRRARAAPFLEMVQAGADGGPVSLLDVGGTAHFWRTIWHEKCQGIDITLLNVDHQPEPGDLPIRSTTGDARSMPQFADGQFHFRFSNSVIEHVGSIADQKRAADEIRRVAKAYWVQTPYRYFPVEPHYHVVGWAQLPVWLRTALHRRMDLGWVRAEPDYLRARVDVESCRLLSMREFRLLFPDGEIRRERIAGLTKSLIAVRPM
jgi:hypothetical protein